MDRIVWRDREVPVERVVVKEVAVMVDRIVEKFTEVPVERIVYKEVPVEVRQRTACACACVRVCAWKCRGLRARVATNTVGQVDLLQNCEISLVLTHVRPHPHARTLTHTRFPSASSLPFARWKKSSPRRCLFRSK